MARHGLFSTYCCWTSELLLVAIIVQSVSTFLSQMGEFWFLLVQSLLVLLDSLNGIIFSDSEGLPALGERSVLGTQSLVCFRKMHVQCSPIQQAHAAAFLKTGSPDQPHTCAIGL